MREARRGDIAAGILKCIQAGLAVPNDELPKVSNSRQKLQVNPAIADMLRVLLKAKAEAEGVAQKLIATSNDLDALAAGERDVIALKGWRNEVFGKDAMALCNGKIGLRVDGQKVIAVPV